MRIPAENSESAAPDSAPVASVIDGPIGPPDAQPETAAESPDSGAEEAFQFNPFAPAPSGDDEPTSAEHQAFPVMSDPSQPAAEAPTIEPAAPFPDFEAIESAETSAEQNHVAVTIPGGESSGAEVVSASDLSDSFAGMMSESIHGEGQSPKSAKSAEQTTESVFPGLPGASGVVSAAAPETPADGNDAVPAKIEINVETPTPPPAEAETISTVPNIATSPTPDVPSIVPTPVVSAISSPRQTTAAKSKDSATSADATETAGPPVVSKLLFIIVVSYASAVTIALIAVWILYQRGQQLNLPDVVPKQSGDGKVVFNLYPEDAQLPRQHLLNLGDTQRFGHLEITALKVTRGPAVVANEYGEEPTGAVLKLWLKVRNVSSNQTFAPFGRTLVRKRSTKDQRANIFVCRTDQKSRDGNRVLMFDLEVDDATLVLKGQDVDHPLKPGEKYETFLATGEEGVGDLKGDLVWRVQVRKGYNPVSKWGVTTLFEVNFRSDDVKNENQSG